MSLIDIKAAKSMFFDRKAVVDAVDKATRTVLSKFGAFVWKTARNSIRPHKGTSRPGRPPYSHAGTLRKLILFGYDRDNKSVVIGPTLSASPTGAPENLEFGGSFNANGTVIYITGAGRRKKGRAKERVELHGKVTVRPRPYMGPALAAELPKLDGMWRDSVR